MALRWVEGYGRPIDFPDTMSPQEIDSAVAKLGGSSRAYGPGAGFGTRLGAATKMTPEGRQSYLESKFPQGVRQGQYGEEYKQGNEWLPVNQPGADIGDVAGALPALGSATFSTLGGIGGALAPVPGGSMAGAAGGGALWNTVQQGLSSLLPGDDQMSLGERAGSAGREAAFSLGGDLAARGGMAAFNLARPSNVVARTGNFLYNRARQTPQAVEGEYLVQQTGIPLSPGARTQDPVLQFAESRARQHAWAGRRARQHDVKVAEKSIERINLLMDRMHPGMVNPTELGSQIHATYRKGFDTIMAARRSAAEQDYGLVKQLAGGKAVAPTDATAGEIMQIYREYERVPGDEARAVRGKMAELLKHYMKDGQAAPMDVMDALKAMEHYGKASRGAGKVFDALHPSTDRTIAKRLFGAMNRDMDQMAASGQGELGDAIRAARQNYREWSNSAEYLEKSTIGRMLGEELEDSAVSGLEAYSKAPEKLARHLLKMDPSELKVLRSVLDIHNPGLMGDVKRYIIGDALEKGLTPKGASEIPLSGAKFASAMMKEPQMAEIFSKREVTEINNVIEALRRHGDRTGYNPSGTAAAMEFAQDIGAVSSRAIRGAIAVGGKNILYDQIAKAMETPAGRHALLQLTTQKPATREFTRALAIVTGSGLGQATKDKAP